MNWLSGTERSFLAIPELWDPAKLKRKKAIPPTKDSFKRMCRVKKHLERSFVFALLHVIYARRKNQSNGAIPMHIALVISSERKQETGSTYTCKFGKTGGGGATRGVAFWVQYIVTLGMTYKRSTAFNLLYEYCPELN